MREFGEERWPESDLRPTELREALFAALEVLYYFLGDQIIPALNGREVQVRPEVQDLRNLVLSAEQYGGRMAQDYKEARKFVAPLQEEIAKVSGKTLEEKIAENPATPAETLAHLAGSLLGLVREAVARNPNTPVSCLRELAYDNNEDVRRAVMQNPAAPTYVMEYAKHATEEWLFEPMHYCGSFRGAREQVLRHLDDDGCGDAYGPAGEHEGRRCESCDPRPC